MRWILLLVMAGCAGSVDGADPDEAALSGSCKIVSLDVASGSRGVLQVNPPAPVTIPQTIPFGPNWPATARNATLGLQPSVVSQPAVFCNYAWVTTLRAFKLVRCSGLVGPVRAVALALDDIQPVVTLGHPVDAAHLKIAEPVDDGLACTLDSCDASGNQQHAYLPGCGGNDHPVPTSVPKSTVEIGGHAYDSWQQPGETFRFVCEQPCPVADSLMLAKYTGFSHAKKVLTDLVGIDVLPEMMPVNLHVHGDDVCGAYTPGFTGDSQFTQDGAQICLFDAEKIDRFYPFDVEHAVMLEDQILPVHEYGHILFYGRASWSPEWFQHVISYYVSGQAVDMCDASQFDNPVTREGYQLCTLDGMNYKQIKPFMLALDQSWQNGNGVFDQGEQYAAVARHAQLSVLQLRQALNGVLGMDTLHAFISANVFSPFFYGDQATLSPAGGSVTMFEGRVRFDVPAGAVSAPTLVTTKTPVRVVDGAWYGFVYAHNLRLLPDLPLKQPVRLTVAYNPALLPAGADQTQVAIAYAGSNISWIAPVPVAGSVADTNQKTVSAPIGVIGEYVLGPATP